MNLIKLRKKLLIYLLYLVGFEGVINLLNVEDIFSLVKIYTLRRFTLVTIDAGYSYHCFGS